MSYRTNGPKCPSDNEQLQPSDLATHDKECPKAQAYCEFKPYGCKWVGLRSDVPGHLQTDIASHLSLLLPALSVLFPNGHETSNDAASKPDTPSSNLEELNRKVAKNEERSNAIEEKMEEMERKMREVLTRLERQQGERNAATAAMRNSIAELEARSCNGVFLWRITGYTEHLENARQGLVTAVHSPPFYTAFYGYKLCLRINPNGVDTGYGSHISLFVHMMLSEWDDTLEWPFTGRISLSILDLSDDGEYKRHISEILVTRPNMLAFQRPTTPRNHKGYGYVEFAHLETLQERQYVKNNCLLVRVQVYN